LLTLFSYFLCRQKQFATVRAPVLAWDFEVRDDQQNMLASINKNWTGLGKELFLDVNQYVFCVTCIIICGLFMFYRSLFVFASLSGSLPFRIIFSLCLSHFCSFSYISLFFLTHSPADTLCDLSARSVPLAI